MKFDTIAVGLICYVLSWPSAATSKYEGFVQTQEGAAGPAIMEPRPHSLQNANSSDDGLGLEYSLASEPSDPANLTHGPSRNLLGPAAPTLFPGTYTIKNAGRSCRPFASVNADCGNNAIDTWFSQDGSGRQIFSIQRPQNFGNDPNEFTISVSGGRETCNRNLWSTQGCGGSEQPDLWLFDDGSGRQTFYIEPVLGVAGQFYLRPAARRYPCGQYLTGADCSSSDPVIGYAQRDDGTGLQRWILTPTKPPPGSSVVIAAPLLADGAYTINNLGAGCKPALTVQGGTQPVCFDAHLVGGTQPTSFHIQRFPSSDEYTITAQLAGCSYSLYFRTDPQVCQNDVSLYPRATRGNTGDGVRFRIAPVPVNPQLGQYYIIAAEQYAGCAKYITLPTCSNPSVDASLAFGSLDDNGFGELRWTFTPVPTMPDPILQDGDYRIVMSSREGCETQLAGLDCVAPVLSTDQFQSAWTVTPLPGSLDTYTFEAKTLAGYGPGCKKFLSKASLTCDSRLIDAVTFTGAEDYTARRSQSWRLTRVYKPGQDFDTFTIQSVDAIACPSGSFLSVTPCGGNSFPDLYFVDDNSGRQQWTFYRL